MTDEIPPDLASRSTSRLSPTVLGAALACLLVSGGVGVMWWATRPDSPAPVTRTTELPVPPSGTKWVGVGRKVAAVPASWPVIPGIYCGEPHRPYVTITQWHVAVGCEPGRAGRPARSISIEGSSSDGFLDSRGHSDVTTLPSGWLAIPSSATLSGKLLWVGGPAPGTARPHAGIVHVVNADDSVDQTTAAGGDGRWTISLPPGTYRIAATSPGYLTDAGAPDACTTDGQFTVAADQTVTANVYCQLM